MVTDILSYWGVDKLRKYPRTSTQDIAIPDSSKEFLERIGLPVIEDPRFSFKPDYSPLVFLDEAASYRRIGFYDSSPICVKEGEGGVYWYDGDNHSALFMNSSVEAFALLLTLYHQMLVMARLETQSQKKMLVANVEEQMRAMDPRAFTDEELYWPVIFEEIGYELN